MTKEKKASDFGIQLKTGIAGTAILSRKLGLPAFMRMAVSLIKGRLRGEPWKGLPPPRDEKEKITRIEIRDAVIIYRILKVTYGEEKALQLVGEVVAEGAMMLFDYLLDPLNLEELSCLNPVEQHRFVKRNLNRFPNAVTTLNNVSPEKVEFTVTYCHMVELCNLLNHPELAPVFCAADKIYFEETVGVRFKRTHTIAEGSPICDFSLFV